MAIACEVEVNQLAFARIPVLRFPPLIFSDYVIHGARLLILSVLNPFQIAVKPADNSRVEVVVHSIVAKFQIVAVPKSVQVVWPWPQDDSSAGNILFRVKVGNIFTSDSFYRENFDLYKKLASYQVLAVEMESSALYTLAAKYKRNALSILTVSDHILTGEETSSEERQTTFNEMIEVALEAALNK